MNVEIKFGTRKELRAWLYRQKKSGNAVRYVAVDDPKTDQRMMLVLKDPAQKKRMIAEINRNFETGQEKCLDLQIIDSKDEADDKRRTLRNMAYESARKDLIEAMKTGEQAEFIAKDLRFRAREIMMASDEKLIAVTSKTIKETSDDMALVAQESLAGYLQGMAELISQRESAESGTDRFPWWLPVVLAVIALILGIVTIVMQGL